MIKQNLGIYRRKIIFIFFFKYLALARGKKLNLKNLKHFVLDECDKMLAELDMRRDVQVSTNNNVN